VKRILVVIAVLGAAAAAVLLTTGAKEDGAGKSYWVELDNAFGLIEGADVKVAGVRAGKIASMKLDRDTYRALVQIEVKQGGFGSLRTDAFCETRPQSLIGEYFIDCTPGDAKRKLREGATIPVEQTGSTVPVDLVNNIMRRPFRERLTIIINELGAALGARGEDLNETIRRASPALRETDKVLALLADQKETIKSLYTDADVVIDRLADNRVDVGRFVEEARDTAQAAAERRGDLAAQFRRLPTFLRELRPTMVSLGEVADAQIPLLRNLNENAPRLTRFFKALAPFADASRPAFRTLAEAGRAGRPAIRAANPRINELRQFAAPAPEVSTNLALVLEDLDDKRRGPEADARAPGGRYSGYEILMRYVFNQSQAVNIFDGNNYMLKIAAFLDNVCSNYTDAAQAKESRRDRCAAILGPNRPGINQPDPSPGGGRSAEARRASAAGLRGKKGELSGAPGAEAAPGETGSGLPAAAGNGGQGGDEGNGGGGGREGNAQPDSQGLPVPGPAEDLIKQVVPGLPDVPALPGSVPGVPEPPKGGAPQAPRGSSGDELLDFLLGP